MRPVLRRSLILVVVAIILDWGMGRGLGALYRMTNSGELGGLINGALRSRADVLIVGSSRAKHHISPRVLSESIPGLIYNAGVNGQDFLYGVMLLDLWSTRQPAPRIIVWHVDPKSLVHSNQELQKASIFSAFYGESERVREVILRRSRLERLKYLSQSFRYNGKVLPILKNLLVKEDVRSDGFVALTGTLQVAGATEGGSQSDVGVAPPDAIKLRYLDEVVAYCRRNGSRLVLVHSPMLVESGLERAAWIDQVRGVVDRYGDVEFLDLSERSFPQVFSGHPELFMDPTHLNGQGAALYSRLLAKELAVRVRSGRQKTAVHPSQGPN